MVPNLCKKVVYPTLYLTDILYLTINGLSFGQTSICLFACWMTALWADVLFADQPTAGGRGRTCPHGGHAHGRGARGRWGSAQHLQQRSRLALRIGEARALPLDAVGACLDLISDSISHGA